MIRLLRVLLVLVAASWMLATPALGQRARRRGRRGVRVTVVDVAAGHTYVSPGESGGLHLGATVRIGRQSYRVSAITESYAVLDGAAEIGATGSATVRARTDEGDAERLPPPAELAAYEGVWPSARRPSETQHPDPVPIGSTSRSRRLRIDASTGGYGMFPIRGGTDPVGRVETRVRVHAQPFSDVPFTIDADAAVQLWAGREVAMSTRSRPNLRVRQLQIAYGTQTDFYAALGRLRYAASTLGQLDGIRLQTPALGPITVAGFGGFVPDPQTGEPAFNVARFGLEVTYRDVESDIRPVVSLVAQGSVFDGQPDERRLSGSFHFFPGQSHIGGYVELTNFDRDNPWNAAVVEVTAASLDATLRFDWFHVGARASMRQPERSKWLASLFEPGWLCTPLLNGGHGPNDCSRYYDMRLSGNAEAGIEVDDVALDAGATVLHVGARTDLDQLGGYLTFRAVRILGFGHVSVSGMVSNGHVYETYGGTASAGAEIIPETVDFTLRYRPAWSRYSVDNDYFLEQVFGGRVLVRPIPEIDIILDADGLLGRQLDAFLIQLSTAWHGAF